MILVEIVRLADGSAVGLPEPVPTGKVNELALAETEGVTEGCEVLEAVP